MSETGYVYTLVDPRTDAPKYVGATKQPERRLNQHQKGLSNDDVQQWVEELESEGHTPDMNLVNIVPIDELSDAEIGVINRLSGEWDLLNHRENFGYTCRDTNPDKTSIAIEPETRDRLRAAKQGGESYNDVLKRLIEEGGCNGDRE